MDLNSFYKPFHWTSSGIAMMVFFLVVIAGLHVAEALGFANLLPSFTGDISTF